MRINRSTLRLATEVDLLKRLLERCTDEKIYDSTRKKKLFNQRVDSYYDKKLLVKNSLQ